MTARASSKVRGWTWLPLRAASLRGAVRLPGCVFRIAPTCPGAVSSTAIPGQAPGAFERRGRREPVERGAAGRTKPRRAGVHAHDDLAARRPHVMDTLGGRVPAVGEPAVARADGEAPPGLAGAKPFRCREREETAGRGRQADAGVPPPPRARLAGLLDCRRVEPPDLETAVARHRDALFAKRLHAPRAPPLLRFLQPLHQRHGRPIGQARHLRPHDALAQRTSTSDVKQQAPAAKTRPTGPCARLSAPPSRSPTPAGARAETTSTPSGPRPSSRAPLVHRHSQQETTTWKTS